MENPLFLIVESQRARPGEAACQWRETGCRALVKAGCCGFWEAGCRCTQFCTTKHRSLACLFTAWLVSTGVKSASRETVYQRRAGDGTRTRDSLLGRKTVAQDPRIPLNSALQAVLRGFVANRAANTKTVQHHFLHEKQRYSLC